MADVKPLRALHYDPAVAGALDAVVAPPYDVIDPEQRAQLADRSPYNVVRIDLPEADEPGGDPYAAAAGLLERWQADGAVVRDDEPAIWALVQDFTGPDGTSHTRRGLFARVRVEEDGAGRVRPHERTPGAFSAGVRGEEYGAGRTRPHGRTPPGPREDRLRLTRATKANLSPIFSLYSDPHGAAWQALEPATEQPPFGETTDEDGTR